MTSGILLIKAGDELSELVPTAYDSEAVLQRLLARFPSLIPGAQLDPASRGSGCLFHAKRESRRRSRRVLAGTWTTFSLIRTAFPH